MIVTLTWPPPPSHMVMSALADVRTGLLMEVLGANAQVRSGSAGEVLARPDRAGAPGRAHLDLRRRHQRDPARHHRGGRARPSPGPAVGGSAGGTDGLRRGRAGRAGRRPAGRRPGAWLAGAGRPDRRLAGVAGHRGTVRAAGRGPGAGAGTDRGVRAEPGAVRPADRLVPERAVLDLGGTLGAVPAGPGPRSGCPGRSRTRSPRTCCSPGGTSPRPRRPRSGSSGTSCRTARRSARRWSSPT